MAASIRSLFHGDWSSEIRWKKVCWQNWMDEKFNVRIMYSTVEIMDGCKYSIEIINVPLKELIAKTNFFRNKLLLLKVLLKQWMTTSFPVKINTVTFKEWMTAIFLWQKQMHYFKGYIAAIRVVKSTDTGAYAEDEGRGFPLALVIGINCALLHK